MPPLRHCSALDSPPPVLRHYLRPPSLVSFVFDATVDGRLVSLPELEVTNVEDDESGKDCVICLSELRNTDALPCRHMRNYDELED
ncbi:hypothetical protein FCM35_KLT17019 [Carex littledalei]|uniref:Uncharacterized protein n=1 Tax=Carex littledalei TaxID=544730 RepID=A0A833RFP2_9POAL|nr:hypothetical protein FCM35_KLT17019 [Carex littledalei]